MELNVCVHASTVIASVVENLVYRKKISARTMSVTAHIYAPYPTHIQLCKNIQTQAPCFPLSLSLHRWQIRGGANKTTNSCQVENSIKTRHITFTHTNVYYVPNTRTCCIHQQSEFGSYQPRHATLFVSMHIHHTYTFSKRTQQAACEHTR